mgnify:CR=1 FL=1
MASSPPLPAPPRGEGYTLVIGSVVGVYIDDAFSRDGLVQSGAMRALARSRSRHV